MTGSQNSSQSNHVTPEPRVLRAPGPTSLKEQAALGTRMSIIDQDSLFKIDKLNQLSPRMKKNTKQYCTSK